jgi:gamma-glutamyl-gamma-aminobutyrate hydrolase PuuD
VPRPRILITRAEDVTGERWDDYADRVRAAGGDPVAADLRAWRPGDPSTPAAGLLLTGGVDIDPARYGRERDPRVSETNPDRDAFEFELLQQALDTDTPVLAVCRGHQLFNVAHGGALLQHIEEREPHRSRRDPADREVIASGWHEVDVRPGTRLAAALGAGATRVRVNSRHHQAVTPDTLAPGLTIAATTDDGIIEALEDASQRWAVSVQWHPERAELAQDALFEAFVRACGVAPA